MTLLWGTKRVARKKKRCLNHQQKRELAKDILSGKHVKQVAAKWDISLNLAYSIINEYVVTWHSERFPDTLESKSHRAQSAE
jgi:DNA invertase Pin-like site-specific DNA recombinase